MRLINPVRCIIRPLVPLPLVSYPRAATKNKSFINSRCLVTTRSSPSLPSFTKTGNFDNSHTCDYLHNSSINGRNVEHQPNDQRTLQLGKTIRTLHSHLPNLLASPLPQDILSPDITLHLFPSTHPHLPTVSGRIPYTGALWTAPVAWGRVPVVGNVKLDIMSERMVQNGGRSGVKRRWRDERFVVKWKTCSSSPSSTPTTEKDGKTALFDKSIVLKENEDIQTRSSEDSKSKVATVLNKGISTAGEQMERLRGLLGSGEEFCGIFVFEFDDQARIIKHTIEHVERGGKYDKMTKVVDVTDWLLGRALWKRREEIIPGLAIYKAGLCGSRK